VRAIAKHMRPHNRLEMPRAQQDATVSALNHRKRLRAVSRWMRRGKRSGRSAHVVNVDVDTIARRGNVLRISR